MTAHESSLLLLIACGFQQEQHSSSKASQCYNCCRFSTAGQCVAETLSQLAVQLQEAHNSPVAHDIP
jgi:hypothetical protein